MNELTAEQFQILQHTDLNGRYCGSGDDLKILESNGLMKKIGKTAWCPDPYWMITDAGRELLAQIKPAGQSN